MSVKERIKQYLLYLNGKLLSNTHVQPIHEFQISCSQQNIKYYANTPNTIIYFNIGEREGFFRECRLHEEKHKYVERLVDEYCKYVFVNENSAECKHIIMEKLNRKSDFNKFFNMGAGTARYTNITKFRRTLNSDYIGLPKPYPDWFKDQLLQLLQYSWGALDEYKYNSFMNFGEFHTYSANRTIGTKKIADLIGCEDLVPESKYMRLIIDNEERTGVAVDVAKGVSPESAKKQGLIGVTPQFQKYSLNLHLLDVICYQKDHRPGNYFISLNNKFFADSLCAFDNDCPTTFFPSSNIGFYSYIGCSPIVTSQGDIKRPFLDRKCIENILSLNATQVSNALKSEMTKFQLRQLMKRIVKLQKAINKSVNNGITKLIDEDEWNDRTIIEETSGKYGVTYLKYFVDKYCTEVTKV